MKTIIKAFLSAFLIFLLGFFSYAVQASDIYCQDQNPDDIPDTRTCHLTNADPGGGPLGIRIPATCVSENPNDTIYGTNGADVIVAGTGNNTVYAGNGDDLICGNEGDDTIYGENGQDRVIGGNGIDVIYGGNGDDKLEGSPGDDLLYGENGDDYLDGRGGTDKLDGGKGDDECLNGEENSNCEF